MAMTNDEPIKLSDRDFNLLYEDRLLFFIEREPHSNKYSQIILTEKEYMLISTFITNLFKCETREGIMYAEKIPQSTEEYRLPDLQARKYKQ